MSRIHLVALFFLFTSTLARADIQVFPNFIEFGDVSVGGLPQTDRIRIANLGSSDVHHLRLWAFTSDAMSITDNCMSQLETGQSCYVTVRFRPSHIGYFTSYVRIDWEDGSDWVDIHGHAVQN